MKKLLAIDMDGTCLNSRHRISDQNMAALHRAAKAGIIVVPTTGRTVSCIPGQLENSAFYRYIISSNGADVLDRKTGCSLYQALISYQDAAELLKKARSCGLGLSVHGNHEFYVQGLGLNLLGRLTFGREGQKAIYVKNLSHMVEQKKLNVEEIQCFYFTDSKRSCAARLFSSAPGLVSAFDRFYVETYALTASKGNALKAVARQLGIEKQNIFCIGDAENDLSMFEAAGVKFAMGNAIPALKEKADAVLPSNDESGVAWAIEKFLLK